MTNRDRLLILFEQLIAFDSPSYGEREICDFIKGRLADLGIAVCEDGTAKKIGGNCGNLYAYVDGALNLPPCTRVVADSVSALPVGIVFSLPTNRLFSNRS